MAGWTKLFSSIVTSSVWCEDHATLRVWVAMLATADAEGLVEGSIPGFANLCRVTVEEMRTAVARLAGPDKDSRTKTHDGRRIEAFDGGWRIVNHKQYREMAQEKEGSRAPYFRKYRRDRAQQFAQQQNVARNTEAEAEAERTTATQSLSPVEAPQEGGVGGGENGPGTTQPGQDEETGVEGSPRPVAGLGSSGVGTPARDADALQEFTDAILEAWTLKCGPGGPLVVSSIEYALMLRWWKARIPLRIVLRGIKDCAGQVGPQTRLVYVGPAVEEAVASWRKAVG